MSQPARAHVYSEWTRRARQGRLADFESADGVRPSWKEYLEMAVRCGTNDLHQVALSDSADSHPDR
jgi:hypothetical protein